MRYDGRMSTDSTTFCQLMQSVRCRMFDTNCRLHFMPPVHYVKAKSLAGCQTLLVNPLTNQIANSTEVAHARNPVSRRHIDLFVLIGCGHCSEL